MNPTRNTFGLIFFTKKANESGECRIYSRITINGKSVDLSTKKMVSKPLWNPLKGAARGTTREALELNDYLEQFRSGIVDAYQEAIIQQKPLTPEHIRNDFLGQDEPCHTFQDLFNYHNEHEKQVLAKGTMKNYYTTQDYILQFLKKSKKPSGWDIREQLPKNHTNKPNYCCRNERYQKTITLPNNEHNLYFLLTFCPIDRQSVLF